MRLRNLDMRNILIKTSYIATCKLKLITMRDMDCRNLNNCNSTIEHKDRRLYHSVGDMHESNHGLGSGHPLPNCMRTVYHTVCVSITIYHSTKNTIQHAQITIPRTVPTISCTAQYWYPKTVAGWLAGWLTSNHSPVKYAELNRNSLQL